MARIRYGFLFTFRILMAFLTCLFFETEMILRSCLSSMPKSECHQRKMVSRLSFVFIRQTIQIKRFSLMFHSSLILVAFNGTSQSFLLCELLGILISYLFSLSTTVTL